MFKLEMRTGNDAFRESPGEEISRIIKDCLLGKWVSEYMPLEGTTGGTLRDSNGNVVGIWEYTPE